MVFALKTADAAERLQSAINFCELDVTVTRKRYRRLETISDEVVRAALYYSGRADTILLKLSKLAQPESPWHAARARVMALVRRSFLAPAMPGAFDRAPLR
jgi:hypothetical protein